MHSCLNAKPKMMPNLNLKESYIFIPFLIVYFILSKVYPFLPVQLIAKFLLFQFLFLLLPGYVFSKYLISLELTKIQRFVLGYPVSVVVLFILSWLSLLLRIRYLEVAILSLAIVAIYQMVKEERVKKCDTEAMPFIIMGIFVYSICIAVTLRLFILPSAPPTLKHLGLFYPDSLWTTDLAWTYFRGLPLDDARFAGVAFGYHMLQSILQAITLKFTQIDPFSIHFYLEPVFDWFIRVFLVLYAGLKILKLSLRQTVIFGIGLFFTNSFFYSEGFQSELFVNPLSFSFGLPVFILFIFCMDSYLNRQGRINILYLTALFIYFTATKAILGITITLTIAAFFILRLAKEKKVFYKDLVLIASLFLGALFIKFTILKNTVHALYYDYDVSKSLVYALLNKAYFIKEYIDFIYPCYRFFSNFFRYVIRTIFNWPMLLFFLLFLTNSSFRTKITNKKNLCILVLIFWLINLAMGSLFIYPSSIVYYYWYPQAAFLILGTFALDYILSISNLKYKIIVFSLLALGIIAQVKQLNTWIKVGFGQLPYRDERIWDKRASIDYGEWQAMEWLKKNTGPSEIFFTDRRFYTHENRKAEFAGFGFYSALSGRRAFAEGEGFPLSKGKLSEIVNERWNTVNQFLSSDDPVEQENLLKYIPADYFIQSLRFNKKDFSKINKFKLVYENNSIRIYKIAK